MKGACGKRDRSYLYSTCCNNILNTKTPPACPAAGGGWFANANKIKNCRIPRLFTKPQNTISISISAHRFLSFGLLRAIYNKRFVLIVKLLVDHGNFQLNHMEKLCFFLLSKRKGVLCKAGLG